MKEIRDGWIVFRFKKISNQDQEAIEMKNKDIF